MLAYDLLCAETVADAMPLALELHQLNARRQRMTREALAAISDEVVEAGGKALIFAGDESLEAGIVGLVAGRLTEAFYRPAIVLEIGKDESRASCRRPIAPRSGERTSRGSSPITSPA